MSDSDAELLSKARRSRRAFAAFYDRYERPVVGYFMRRARDPELAADLTAEVFAAAFAAVKRYRPDAATAAPWPFTIAQIILVSSVRRGRVEERRAESSAFARRSARGSSMTAHTMTSPPSSRRRRSWSASGSAAGWHCCARR